ncbi:hypothetical protein [Kineococcus arenarius]|uniref:hypothetical protein n=1 Tax=unclassified Kineococcus TaxID=2621656 RepID=UPI003D7D4233
MVTAFSYVWIALFTAAFHSRRAVCTHLAVALTGFAAALRAGGAAWLTEAEVAVDPRTGEGGPVRLAVLDLDGSKAVNDRDGHAAGS